MQYGIGIEERMMKMTNWIPISSDDAVGWLLILGFLCVICDFVMGVKIAVVLAFMFWAGGHGENKDIQDSKDSQNRGNEDEKC